MSELHVSPDPEAAARAAAELIADAVREARAQRGAAHVALAGGNTPKRAYEALGAALDGDWSGVHLWFGDERMVSADDPESNYRMAVEALEAGGMDDRARVHRIAGEQAPEEAAKAYAHELRATVPEGAEAIPALDLALQGLGEDGHTASLFPGHPEVDIDDALTAAVHDSPKPPPTRVTLTVPMLRAARRIAFLAEGAGKAGPVAAIMRGPDPALPSSLLGGPQTVLIVDEAAAAEARPG